jgi:hypothetical protein
VAANRPRSLQLYDPVLSNLARRYKPNGFIARRLLPSIPVSLLSGQYPVFTDEYWFKEHTDNRVSDRAPAREVDFEWSTESYLCEEYALKVSITDLERRQADAALKLEFNKTDLLSHQMELSHEIRVAALLNTQDAGGGFDNAHDSTPSTNWDQATATIEEDIKDGVLQVYDTCGGIVPNVIVIPFKVAYEMATQEDIRSLLRYDASGKSVDFIQLGNRVLPSVIHGMQVIIPQGAQKMTGNEGGSTTVSEIWGDDVRLLYTDPNAGWGIPSCAYELRHTPKRVTRWRETDPDVEYIREMERYDLKVVAPKAGFIIKDVLS